jgi:hypothetical protein
MALRPRGGPGLGRVLRHVGCVPEREAQPRRVEGGDHRDRTRVAVGGEVQGLQRRRVGSVDPERVRREVEVAHLGRVVEHLRLVAVFVAPEHRPEGPLRRQPELAGEREVRLRHVERVCRREQVKRQRIGVRPGREGDLDELRILARDVEEPRAPRLHEEAPARRADEERDGRVQLVVAALRLVELALHRTQVAAVVHVVEEAAEAVEGLLRVGARAEADPGGVARRQGGDREGGGDAVGPGGPAPGRRRAARGRRAEGGARHAVNAMPGRCLRRKSRDHPCGRAIVTQRPGVARWATAASPP